MKNHQAFGLRQLLCQRFWLWGVAWLLGLATILSALALTALSGWFLTAAGVVGAVSIGQAGLGLVSAIRYLAVVRTLGRYGELMVLHQAVFLLLKTLRVRFFDQWSKLPLIERHQANIKSSQRTHRLVKDIDVLNEFILRVVSPYLLAIVSILLILAAVWYWLPAMLWVMLPIVLSVVLSIVVGYYGVRLAKTESNLLEKRKSLLLDNLPALTQLIMWRQWQTQSAQLMNADQSYLQNVLQAHALRRMAGLLVQFCLLAAVMIALLLGQTLTLSLPAWQMVAVLLSCLFVIFGLGEVLLSLAQEPLALGRSLVAKHNINAMLGDHQQTKLSDFTWLKSHQLQFDSVAVKAPMAIRPTKAINAVANQNQPCLIAGVSGAGKSTLLHTLAGEYPLAQGQIIVSDGQNHHDYLALDKRAVGFLGQSVDIFDQTLADNLRLGKPDASDDELLFVLEQVGLKSWVQSQPQGLATPLGEYGAAISGGQARRIALARLLLTPKAMLLLDEPFAGLDESTRKSLWQNLLLAQQAGKIGFLLISTHEIWQEMGDVNIITVEP